MKLIAITLGLFFTILMTGCQTQPEIKQVDLGSAGTLEPLKATINCNQELIRKQSASLSRRTMHSLLSHVIAGIKICELEGLERKKVIELLETAILKHNQKDGSCNFRQTQVWEPKTKDFILKTSKEQLVIVHFTVIGFDCQQIRGMYMLEPAKDLDQNEKKVIYQKTHHQFWFYLYS